MEKRISIMVHTSRGDLDSHFFLVSTTVDDDFFTRKVKKSLALPLSLLFLRKEGYRVYGSDGTSCFRLVCKRRWWLFGITRRFYWEHFNHAPIFFYMLQVGYGKTMNGPIKCNPDGSLISA